MKMQFSTTLLILCMFFSGYCGIVCELSLFTLAESLVGGTLTNILATMGIMMFFMGVGSRLAGTRFFENPTFGTFIWLELFLSLSSMVCIPLLMQLHASIHVHPQWVFAAYSGYIGTLIGLEIPIMQKLIEMETGKDIRNIAADVLMADYFGALMGFVMFTLVILSAWGLPFAAYSSGALNLLSAAFICLTRYKACGNALKVATLLTLVSAVVLATNMNELVARAEQSLFRNLIVWEKQTPYQRLVITDNEKAGSKTYDEKNYIMDHKRGTLIGQFNSAKGSAALKRSPKGDFSLYINGGLQFNTKDEAYYHEFLIHPALHLNQRAKEVLIMGGGDGLALREVLKHQHITSVTLVDLDREMINAFSSIPELTQLNQNAFSDKRVDIIIGDAWSYIRSINKLFDVIILDFPDPHHTQTAKLYTKEFYQIIKTRLSKQGVLATQSTSPLYDKLAFMCIRKTLEYCNLNVLACHIEMESFTQWGFMLCSASRSTDDMKGDLLRYSEKVKTHHLNRDAIQASWLWPKSFWSSYENSPVNSILSLALLQQYSQEH